MRTTSHHTDGFTLVEIILAISLFAIVALGAVTSAFYGENAQVASGLRKRASLVAEQSLELVRGMRDSTAGYSSLANGTYGLSESGGVWTLVPGSPDTTGDFQRSVTIATVDDATKSVEASVCWPSASCSSTLALSTYLTNWRGGATGPVGGFKVVASGEGHAYMITTNNTLEVYDVSTPASPTRVGQVSLPGAVDSLPANLYYASSTVFVASGDAASELQIVNVSNPASPSVLGTLNVAVDGTDDSAADAVWGDAAGHVFLLAHATGLLKSQFFMIDASDPTAATVALSGDIFTTADAQTPGGLAVGTIGGLDTMCTTAGGSTAAGYKVRCYEYNFATPSADVTTTDTDAGLSPSRAVAIVGGAFVTTPGGTVRVGTNTPVTVSSNAVYAISTVVRGGRTYAYLAVPGDIANGLKEVDVTDAATPVIVASHDSNGTLSGVAFDSSVTPKYVYGANQTGTSLGFVSILPTAVGLTVSPFAGIAATTTKGAAIVHCDPIVDPGTDSGCPETYSIKNVTAAPITYTATSSAAWVTLSSVGGTLASGATDSLTATVDAAQVVSANLSEGAHTATIHVAFTNGDGDSADLARTITLTVDPALGIKVRSR